MHVIEEILVVYRRIGVVFKYLTKLIVAASAIPLLNCSKGILEPGDVALPMTGLYRLESRTFVAQDSAATVLELLVPPEVRSRLVLNLNGRYGQVDSLETDQGLQVFTETGRWSVGGDDFYLESDDNRFAVEKFAFDQVRLIRTLNDQPGNVPGGSFSIIDVWRR